eukprot:1862555-Pyramimonas_sp.AAC.2
MEVDDDVDEVSTSGANASDVNVMDRSISSIISSRSALHTSALLSIHQLVVTIVTSTLRRGIKHDHCASCRHFVGVRR